MRLVAAGAGRCGKAEEFSLLFLAFMLSLYKTLFYNYYHLSEFYYFFTPYSAAWWQSLLDAGILKKQIQAEKIVIEEILKYNNIKLYSFNCVSIL